MDFHGMKRKNLQTLCKKHGIPGNLKNDEMASRLASLFEKETAVVNEITPEPIKDDLAVSREAKKVKFSPENEVFEFTRSVKKCQRRNARTCREQPAQGEIALRRSKRSVLNKNKEEELVKDNEKEVSVDFKVEETRKYNRRNMLDAPKVEKVLRRSRRFVNKDEVELNTHEDFKIEKELVKNNVKEVYEDFEVEETKKCNQRNGLDALKAEKVLRRSRRLVNNSEVELNHEDSKIENEQSIKLTTDVAKPCIGGETADSPLCPPKDGKEERKVKKSKGSGAANGTEGEPAKDDTKKSSIDCKLQKNEKDRKTKMQDVEKVPRRSKRLGNNVNVDTDMKPVVDEKRNALKRVYLEKSDNSQGGALGSHASELLEDGEAQKGDNQLKNSAVNDLVGAAVDNTEDQAMVNLSKKCSARGEERDGASVDTMDQSKVNDETKVPARFTKNSARQNSKKVPVVVEENMVKKKDQTLDSLVKSPKRVTRRMKRGRTEELSMSKDTLSIQRIQTPEKFLVVNGKLEPGDAGIRNVTELGGTNVEAESSSKKTKTVNQELVKDNQQGIVEGSTSSSKSKTIEHDMIAENVFDSSPRKSVDSSKKTNTQEVSSDLVEEGREGKHEQDRLFMVALKKDKEVAPSLSAVLIERSSINKSNDELQSEVKTFSDSGNSDGYLVVETTLLPTSVPLALSEPEVELSIPTVHIFEDNALLAIAEEDIRPKEEALISTHRSDLKEHNSVFKLAEAEALENAAGHGKKVYSDKYHEEGSPEKDIQAAKLHGNFSEYDTVNISAEAQADISKVDFEATTVPITRMLEEQELVKDKLQGMIKEPSSSETKAIEKEPVGVNELECTPKIPADVSQRTNTQELSSELMEKELESNHEQDTILMIATNKDKEEASSLSLVPIERSSGNDNTGLQSKVKTCPDNHSTDDYLFVEPTPPFASVQLTISNLEAELIKPTDHIFENNTLTVIRTKEDTLISTHRPELKDNSSVSKLETTAKMETSAERGKEIILCKDNEKGLPEKEIQAANLHGNLAECNSENINAEKVAKITKVECDTSGSDGNISSQMILMLITSSLEEQTVSEQKEAYEMSPNKVNEDAETGSTSKEKSLLVKPNLPNMDIGPVFVEEVCMESVSNVGTAQTAKNVGKTGLISPLCKGREYSMEKTPLSISMDHSSTEPNICGREEIDLHAKVDGSVTYEKNNVLHGDKSKDMANNVVLLSTSTTRSQEESPSRRGKDNLNLKDNDNLTEEKKEASFCEVRNCEKLEPPVEPKDSSLVKSEQAMSGERGCKLHSLELREWSLTDFATLSPKVENVSNCAEEDELKALSQPLPTNRAVSVLDESPIFTIPERNSQLMEQLSKNGKTRAAHSVTSHNYEAVQSRDIIFTTPEQGLFMGYTGGVDEAGNKKGHKATDIPDESDILNTSEGSLMLEDSRQNEAKNNGESIAVEIHDESIIATSPVRHTSVRDCEGDVGGKSEENKNVEFHGESDICSSPDKHILSRNSAPHGEENSGGNEALEFFEKSVISSGMERHELYGYFGEDKARDDEENKAAWCYEEPELREVGCLADKSSDKSSLLTSLERQLMYGDSSQKEARKTREEANAEFHHESVIPNIPESDTLPEDYELNEAAKTDEVPKSEENKVVELHVDFNIIMSDEHHSAFETSETDEGVKRDNITAKFHDESDFFTTTKSHSLMGDSELDEAEKFSENKNAELLEESNLEGHHITMNSDINQYQSHYASSPIVTLKDDIVVPGQESASKPKDYQANDMVGLHAICEPLTMEPDTSKTETIGLSVGAFSSHREVSGASCSLVSEKSAPSTCIQNQINDAPVGSPIAETKGISDLLEAEVTNNTREGLHAANYVQTRKNRDHEGNLQLFTSCDTSVFEETCVSAEKDGLNLGFNRIEDSGNTCEESGCNVPEDEATDSIAATFTLQNETRGQFTFQNNKNEKGEEMVPEEALNESSYGTRTPCQKQTIRPPTLIHRTQVKPKRHDMKENAQNSKIVQNLNVTAPRTSKRQPLQDLRKIN